MEILLLLTVNIVIMGVFVVVLYAFRGSLSQRDIALIDAKMDKNKQDLEYKKDSFALLVEQIKKELDKSKNRLEDSNKEHTTQFTKLATELKGHSEQTAQLRDTTENLKKILSDNRLRGQWGEEVAEDLLRSVGFVKGQTYTANKTLPTTGTRPDLTLLLPDGTKVNIDVKFPFDALVRYHESETEVDKERHLSAFKQAVSKKIKEATRRGYINPEEQTVDFVIVFVPNEMIFSFIHEKMNELWNEAFQKKVILAGPVNFTAILRIVFQSHTNFAYQKNISRIVGLIRVFEQEYQKFSDSLDTLGKRIESAQSEYGKLAGTRDRQLTKVLERIKGEDIPKRISED